MLRQSSALLWFTQGHKPDRSAGSQKWPDKSHQQTLSVTGSQSVTAGLLQFREEHTSLSEAQVTTHKAWQDLGVQSRKGPHSGICTPLLHLGSLQTHLPVSISS